MRTAGVVLCGGRSSRMGAPKAWLPFGGELMLPRVVRIVREAVNAGVVVVAAPGQDVPPLPGDVDVVRDEVEGRGPLAGLATGLTAVEGTADAVFLSSCDVPLLKPEFVRRMVNEFEHFFYSTARCDIAVPYIGNRPHPLAAVYSTALLPRVRTMLAANQLRMTDLMTAGWSLLVEDFRFAGIDPQFHSLRNINTPDDYATALRELGAL